MDTQTLDPEQARARLAAATGAALLVAGIVLVTCVLPAEYAVDPLGTGARLGLMQLGETGRQVEALEDAQGTSGASAGQPVIVGQEKPFHRETVDFRIGPRAGMEYKYRLDKGEALLYSWKAPVPVNYELHAEPDGAPRGYAQSYEKIDGRAEASGTLVAPFAGIHGWYWENTSDQEITVTLTTAGFYNLAHEFRSNGVKNKTFQ
jgi:hypothetical protein